MQQVSLFTAQTWEKIEGRHPYQISAHAEIESMGNHDLSLDLDRAWFATPLAKSQFVWGRIHPFDVSSHPNARRPWGLTGTQLPQHKGTLLGNGYDRSPFPRPWLLGWIGVHFWSHQSQPKKRQSEPFEFGFSATPFYIPSIGPVVRYDDEENPVGRFGRRVPGFAEINGTQVPIRYDIDSSNIVQDVLLQPQASGQLKWTPKNSRYQAWLSILTAPDVNASPDANTYLGVEENRVEAVAVIRPKYKRFLMADITQSFAFTEHRNSFKINASLLWKSTRRYGYEVWLDNPYLLLSYLDERSYGPPAGGLVIKSPQGDYTEQLLRFEGRLPIGTFTPYLSVLTHLKQDDAWIRLGLRKALTERGSLDVGSDIFYGPTGSYFEEWRTNDRLFVAFTWRFFD